MSEVSDKIMLDFVLRSPNLVRACYPMQWPAHGIFLKSRSDIRRAMKQEEVR